MNKKVRVLFFVFILLLPFINLYSLPARNVEILTTEEYFETVHSLLNEASQSILLVMFSFRYYPEYPLSPSNILLEDLIKARRRGVDVKVLLDVSDWNKRNTRKNQKTGGILSRNNIEVYYDKLEVTMHAKTLVVDSRYTVIGSNNWTYHGLTSNIEFSLLVDSEELAKEMENYIMELIMNFCN